LRRIKLFFLQKVDKFGSVDRRVSSGCHHSTRTVETTDDIADLVQSQNDQLHSHLTVRQLSHELSIPRASVHDIIKQDLTKVFKKKKCTRVDGGE